MIPRPQQNVNRYHFNISRQEMELDVGIFLIIIIIIALINRTFCMRKVSSTFCLDYRMKPLFWAIRWTFYKSSTISKWVRFISVLCNAFTKSKFKYGRLFSVLYKKKTLLSVTLPNVQCKFWFILLTMWWNIVINIQANCYFCQVFLAFLVLFFLL